ncbi:MAG: LysM domain-containing protein [Bacteroidetes bacterium]|nr:MAG: LysM domain-containing protein [Bacteroidota bacterium]
MKSTSTLFQRCSFLLHFCVYVCVCSQAKAQSFPQSVPTEWTIGNQTVILSKSIKNAIELRVAEFDTVHIKRNIEPIMLTLEWVRTLSQSTQDSIPVEFCYLTLLENHLIKPYHNKSQITRKADNAFWGLSKLRIDKLRLQNSLHQNEYLDDSHNLYLATTEMFKLFKSAQDYFENWALAMTILDYGYEDAKTQINQKLKTRLSYKGNKKFALDLHSNVLIEYFAMRHILEHIIIKQPAPKKNLACHFPDKVITLEKAHRLYETSIEDLQLYNPWIKGKKTPKDVTQCWFTLDDRGHSYTYPSLPKKKPEPEPKTPQPKQDLTQKTQENGASPKDDDKFLVPAPENITVAIPHLHKVRKGETLFFIAKTYNISIEQLRNLNPHKSHTNLIRIGDVLLIRAKDMREQMDRQSIKLTKVVMEENWRGGIPNTFQKRQKYNRYQQRIEVISTPAQRGGNLPCLPRLSPTPKGDNRVYKILFKKR